MLDEEDLGEDGYIRTFGKEINNLRNTISISIFEDEDTKQKIVDIESGYDDMYNYDNEFFENLQLMKESEFRMHLEGLKPTTAKAGDTYVNTHNLTFFYIFDSKEKANSANYWDEAILSSNYYSKLSKEEINSKLDFIEHSSFKNNIMYSKNFTTVKIIAKIAKYPI